METEEVVCPLVDDAGLAGTVEVFLANRHKYYGPEHPGHSKVPWLLWRGPLPSIFERDRDFDELDPIHTS